MLRLLSMFTYFLRELIFDSKDEYSFKSSKFNPRKVVVFTIVVVSVVLNFYFFNRTFAMAKSVNEIKHEVERLKELDDSNKKTIEALTNQLISVGKNNISQPLNEGNNQSKNRKGK
jgi:uncharacterized membrane protein YgaE (UPF0421/DUF939 family)